MSKNNDKSQIRRRHSITLCESRNRKFSTESNGSTGSTVETADGPNPTVANRQSPPKEFASLNVAAIEHQTKNNSVNNFENECDFAPKPLKTLDLRLEEVAHIRSVLTKAELEAMPLDSGLRDSIARGKVNLLLDYFLFL